jgi:hypothetical protein
MEISYSSTCLSPSSSLASQFSQSIAFSPTSDDLTSRITRHVFLPNQSTISNLPTTTNLILSLKSTPNRFEFFHPQQRRDQQTIVTPSTNTSTSNTPTSSHVLCR